MTNGNFKSKYMLTGMAVVVILSIIWLFFEKREAKQKIIINIRKGWIPAAICGLSNALLNLCLMYSLNYLSPCLIFPIVNGGGLFLSYGLSVILYKEKLNLPQVVGFVSGIISIAIMNI
jgi:drug/metabolite transporter (DMT)-like permease